MNVCDYCGSDLLERFSMRAVGFTEFEGSRAPLVKTWCEGCKPDDSIDHDAATAFAVALAKQRMDGLLGGTE